jgi:hypothetical protein
MAATPRPGDGRTKVTIAAEGIAEATPGSGSRAHGNSTGFTMLDQWHYYCDQGGEQSRLRQRGTLAFRSYEGDRPHFEVA